MSPRRFSLVPLIFLALWTLWFLLPSTGEVAQSQWKARFVTAPTAAPGSGLVSAPASDQSRDAAFMRAFNAKWTDGRDNARRRALEDLGQRFPDDAAICAAQMTASVSELHLNNVRHPGPYSSSDANWSVRLPPNPIQTPSPELLKSWFAATARGAKLEPNNTFWDWTQIIGLLAQGRNDEVWDVLRAARNKTGYDDHVNDTKLAQLTVARRQQMTTPMSQIGIVAGIYASHDGTMRAAARMISDNASGLRIRGGKVNQKQALEGMRDFAQVASIMRRESKSTIESLVGMSIEAIALFGGSYSPLAPRGIRKPRIGAPVAAYANDPRSLLFFARQMGRNDIATQLGKQWVEIGIWQAKPRGVIMSGSSTLIGLNARDIAVPQAADWFGSLILAGIPALLAVALLCSLLLRFVPALRRESTVQPSTLSWCWGAYISIAALVSLSSAGLYALWNTWRSGRTTPLDLLLASLGQSNTNAATGIPISWQSYLPAVLGIFAALWLASIWDTRRQGKPTLGTRLLRLFRAPDDGIVHFDLSPLLALTGTISAFILISFGVVGFLLAPMIDQNFKFLHDYAGLVLLGFTVVFALSHLLRLRTAQSRAIALIMVRRIAWGQLLFLTVLWGVLWLSAMPSQQRFDAAFTRQLQVGEFQLVRKQVGL